MTVLVRAASLQGYEALARECGVDPIHAMARVHLSPSNLADVDSLIPYTSLIFLLEQTASESGCADFGLRLAKIRGVGVLGQLAVLFQHASTLGEALMLASRYIFVHSPAVRLEVVPAVGATGLTDLTFTLDIPHLPPCAQIQELSIGLIVNSILTISQGLVKPLEVRLPHAQLGATSSYQAVMGCPCVFNAATAAVRLEAAALQQVLPANNQQLRQSAQKYLDEQFGDPAQHFGDRIRSMVRRFLSSGMGNQAAIARALSINPRTLQRRLAAEGLYFEDIVDDMRKQQITQLLALDDAPPLVQVAMMLGYTEASALNRSCRRWYGCTPGVLRHTVRKGNTDNPVQAR